MSFVPDLVVVGAGPGGSAAARYAARAGLEVLLIDAAAFPRDKTCGDGLTPRAIHQLGRLGLADAITARYRNRGLKLHGFGGSVTAPWPAGPFGQLGSALPRRRLDQLLVDAAIDAGATFQPASPVVDVAISQGRATALTVTHQGREETIPLARLIVADGVRSPVGKLLGRTWHREEVYGIAARSYCATPRHDEPWIHSHLELRDSTGAVKPGYGWIFPLGDGDVNLGCGALSTTRRPARVNTKKLLSHYAAAQREDWQLGPEREVASASLPMGGAVSNVAGENWLLIGDAAACVNPLNGEGIDYALETAELAVELLAAGGEFTHAWPELLRGRYGAAFELARSAARLLTHPAFLPAVGPIGLRGPLGARLMPVAARLMGNLVAEEDRDLIARSWRAAGAVARGVRRQAPLWGESR